MSSFELYLKNLIDNKKLNQSQVAIYAGTSESAVSLWLSGKRKPQPEFLKKLAPVLNVAFEELMKKAGYLDEEPEIKVAANHSKPIRDLTDLTDTQRKLIDNLIKEFKKENTDK